MTSPVTLSAITIAGTTTSFNDSLVVTGSTGTALLIDAGGTGIFEAASAVTLDSNATVGDAGGAGTLSIDTNDFLVGTAGPDTNLVLASSAAAAKSLAEISGGLVIAGDLLVGQQAAAQLDLSGTLDAVATTISTAGTLIATGSAIASFGGLVDAGTLTLEGNAQAAATNLILTGTLQLQGDSALTGLSSAVIGGAGSLVIGAGADLSTSGVNELGGTIVVAGSLQVAGNLLSAAAISLSGGTLDAAAATFSSGAVLSGYGDVVLGAGSKILGAGGDIVASNGTLVLDGNLTLSGGSSVAIAGSAALDLIDGAGGGSILFEGAGSELIINNLALVSASVSGMVGHDVIDLAGVAPSLVSYASGVISAKDTGGNAIGSFSLSPAGGQPSVEIVSDGSGGALVTLGDELACFVRGTRLLTPNGYMPVETFKPGDPIITQAGIKLPVRWIGRWMMQSALSARTDYRPVVVLPGALGPGIPSREVRLSPSHAVFLGNALVPVMHLVNGATIIRERKPGLVAYYHIELDRHAVVMADGLPVETYLDTGNRGQFQHETGQRGHGAARCAPLVIDGPNLSQARWGLHEIALRAGFTLAQDPALRAMAADLTLKPEILLRNRTSMARFRLPPDIGRILLIAQSAAPADTDPDSDDRRELGICLRQPRAKKDRLRIGAGWYEKAAGDAGIWMGTSGEMFVPPGMTQLTLPLAAVVQSWRPPPAIDFQSPPF